MHDNPNPQVPPGHRYFAFVSCSFVACLIISNIAAQKLIPVGPFVFTGGILLFPVTYIFGDVLTEVYGYTKTRQTIWAGFLANVLMAGFLAIVVALPPAPGWELQEQFKAVLSMIPRIVAASILAYLVGEFGNSYVMARMKVWSDGKHLWMRTIGSTIVGQLLDTVVFVIVAFAGIFPVGLMLTTILSGYVFKVAYEAVATPITYGIVNWLKAVEGMDVFDRDTNFNPFTLRIDEGTSESRTPT